MSQTEGYVSMEQLKAIPDPKCFVCNTSFGVLAFHLDRVRVEEIVSSAAIYFKEVCCSRSCLTRLILQKETAAP